MKIGRHLRDTSVIGCRWMECGYDGYMTTDFTIVGHLRDTLAVAGWNMDMKDKDMMDMKIWYDR